MKKRTGSLAGRETRYSIVIALTICLFVFLGRISAKPAGCPCSPCKCGTCHCGAGGGGPGSSGSGKSSKGEGVGKSSHAEHYAKDAEHHDDHHGRDHGYEGGVGVGGTVDLGGIGQRQREPDPFAASSSSTNTPHTQTKHQAKTTTESKPANPFTDVKLTGELAKGSDSAPGQDVQR